MSSLFPLHILLLVVGVFSRPFRKKKSSPRPPVQIWLQFPPPLTVGAVVRYATKGEETEQSLLSREKRCV